VVEVPPGPPVMSPLVAEVYGPDEAGRQQLAARAWPGLRRHARHRGHRHQPAEDAPRAFLRVQRQRAESLGIPVASIAQTVQGALSGVTPPTCTTATASTRCPCAAAAARAQVGLDALLALPCAPPTAAGAAVGAGAVERGVIDKPLFTKDLQPVSYVFGDMAGGKLDSPLYGLFAIRDKLDSAAACPGTGELGEYWIRQPDRPLPQYAIKWDGEWQITYETFRDMGAAYGVGLILIYLLVVAQFKSYLTPLIIMAPIPLTIIGVMPGMPCWARSSPPPA
jgi:multidrug efflux pump subunit AcrB